MSKSYIYLGPRLLSTLTPNGSGGEFVQYHHPDRLGTRLVTNAQDTTYFEQVALPFGAALDAESTGSTKRRLTSYDRSSTTGLDYAVNRHYDSQQGRFTQVDPIGMGSVSLSSPQTLNLYAYCVNDPINHVDPSGLGFFSFIAKVFKKIQTILKWVAIAVAIAFVVVAIVAGPVTALALLLKIGGAVLGKLGILKSVPMIMNFTEGTIVGGGLTIGLTGQILAGAMTVGAVANHLQQQKQQQKKDERPNKERALIVIGEKGPPPPKSQAEKQKDYQACLHRVMREPNIELAQLMNEHLDTFVLGNVAIRLPSLWNGLSNFLSLAIWQADLAKFNREVYEPARQAAIKTCRKEAGLD